MAYSSVTPGYTLQDTLCIHASVLEFCLILPFLTMSAILFFPPAFDLSHGPYILVDYLQ